ncbi:MAG: hypothetical protein VX189_00560 [Planctomycetota bacterium]|nr:hypothetical protein [Planctomycetota bacterium]
MKLASSRAGAFIKRENLGLTSPYVVILAALDRFVYGKPVYGKPDSKGSQRGR